MPPLRGMPLPFFCTTLYMYMHACTAGTDGCHAHAQVSPTTLILIEGCGQLGSTAAMNWQGYSRPLSSSAAMHTLCME